jgi:hypothetical protein
MPKARRRSRTNGPDDNAERDGVVTRRRWMALFFAVGSTCFLIGPFPGYVQLVGASADGITFFVGSILFTAGGAVQSWLAWPDRRFPGKGRAAWWSAIVQSAGTLFFNVTTYQAMHVALTSPDYNKLVWRPDWRGSICFLVSGAIAYRASARHGWLPQRGGAGWWQPTVNLLGCIFFGISAIAGYVVPSTGSMLDQAAANWNTSLGAACFLACALDTLCSDRVSKMPIRRELRKLELELEDDLHRVRESHDPART